MNNGLSYGYKNSNANSTVEVKNDIKKFQKNLQNKNNNKQESYTAPLSNASAVRIVFALLITILAVAIFFDRLAQRKTVNNNRYVNANQYTDENW